MARQLSSLDTQFLNAETRTTPTHIGLLVMLDPSGVPDGRVTVEDVRAVVASRLHLIAPLRWRLQPVPFGLGLPYWLDGGAVDLSRQIHQVRLPRPGTDQQLAEQVAGLAERSLPRDRPLWECHLIDGLADGRQALYAKVHHAVIDGVSAAEVLGVLFDVAPSPAAVSPPPSPLTAEAAPGTAALISRAVIDNTVRGWRMVLRAPQTVAAVRGLGPVAGSATDFNAPLSSRRTVAFGSVPLAEMKRIKDAFGLTVNDVVMALCSSALRRWLYDRGTPVTAPLVAAIPVSVRTNAQAGTAGNRFSLMLTELPVDEAEVVARLRRLQASLGAAKQRTAAAPTDLLQRLSESLPQIWHGVGTRLLARALPRIHPLINLLVSNVPGPQVSLYVAGAQVIATYPLSVVSDLTGGINITVMSYEGQLWVGVIGCPDVAPAVGDLARYLCEALDEMRSVLPAAV
jgi:WS/DGAT/MGAT family acyltransferase